MVRHARYGGLGFLKLESMIQITEHYKGGEKHDFKTKIAAGFKMTFENGNTISVQFGSGNYCTNRQETKSETTTAEIAIWNKNGDWYDFGGDQVKGYCNANKVAKWIDFAAKNSF